MKMIKTKIMKHLKNLIIILILLIGLGACRKSFLDDVTDKGALIRQDYITDLETTTEYLNGIYNNLGNNLFEAHSVIYPELIADNIKPVGSDLGAQYNWNQQTNETGIASGIGSALNCNNISYAAYKVVRSANFVLEMAEKYHNQDVAKANAIKGQAYAIRALAHFILVNYFAQQYSYTLDGSHPGIAYITSSNWTDPVKGRNTVAEVYTNLISDFNNAISLLPQTTTSTIIMNRNAARALLARVYLFKGDWVLAKVLARQVGTTVPIMMVNYPSKLFTLEETEALFQLPPGKNVTIGNGSGTLFASIRFKGTIRFRATSDIGVMLNEDPNDVRKAWLRYVPPTANTLELWNIVKFPEGVVAGITPTGSYYHTVIRSSEMYLTAAEAYAQLNNVDSARFYLDAIRKRANPAALATTSTGLALLEAIYKERRKELAFEGLRMFDLLRWKKGVNRGDALSVTAQKLPYPSNKAIAPIPGLDVKVSGLSQNPDY